jgi:hypothetical protein
MTKKSIRLSLASGAFALSLSTLGFAAQQPSLVVDGDDVTIRGCVGRAAASTPAQPFLIWSRSDIMLSNVAAGTGQPGLTERVFYWLEDEDDLSKHVGQMVEVKGDLGNFKTGEVEIDREDEFTEIRLKLNGKSEKARVPTAWLGPNTREGDFDIPSRKIDVDSVKVLGACASR